MTIAQKTLDLIQSEIGKLSTAAVGVVDTFYTETLTADIKLKNKIGKVEVLLPGVPIAYPSSSAGAMLWTLAEGDLVLLVFTKWDVKELLKDVDACDVNETLKFSVNNAVAIPGLFARANDPPYQLRENEIVIRHSSGAGIKFSGDGVVKIVAKDFNVQDMNLGAEL